MSRVKGSNGAVLKVEHGSSQTQTQAKTFLRETAGLFHVVGVLRLNPVESLKNQLKRTFGDRRTRIPELQPPKGRLVGACRLNGQMDEAAPWRVFEGIGQNIQKDLVEKDSVSARLHDRAPWPRGRSLGEKIFKTQVLRVPQRLQFLDEIRQDGLQIKVGQRCPEFVAQLADEGLFKLEVQF